ncbi:mitochondrial Rho GTPase 1 [[Candida] railenensis]|uniref:Mitochondrial Rho GTPase 1 n=1 Tax=[Candida] railenensis TaxID=45579 RepID=A0A9P0QT48_9ASCO|nr:mitochondrial Rho GTPase 1 [[Candida] railenensis]
MTSNTVRIVVCGDEAVGKSSLITALLKEEFEPNIQKVIPPITISKEDYATSAYEYLMESESSSATTAAKSSTSRRKSHSSRMNKGNSFSGKSSSSSSSSTFSPKTSAIASSSSSLSSSSSPSSSSVSLSSDSPDKDLTSSSGSIHLSRYIPTNTILVDTNSSDAAQLQKELKRADAIWLVYSDHYTYERISIHWLAMFRSMGVSLPIVICANKSDIQDATSSTPKQQNAEEFVPLINEFKEVEACIRCSAKSNYNVSEAYYLCERAITHPISPIFDSKEGNLKPSCVVALKRIFFLCDKDQDGFLNFEEFSKLHMKCFNTPSTNEQFQTIINTIGKTIFPDENKGDELKLSEDGFILLNKIYAERGRHETIWGILRSFQYTNSLSLQDKFLFPQLDIPNNSSVELGPIGYRFLVDLFLKFDKDNDGGLNEVELNNLFVPTPGIPKLWQECQFPSSIVRNEEGYVSLQGWLAQWSLTTFLDYKTTLEYLAYLGFDDYETSSIKALKVTKPRKTRQKQGKHYRQQVNDRNVFNCFIIGAPGCGKTSLLESFLRGSFSEVYNPTIKPRICVKDIELRGGKQCYLILEELGELEPAILENKLRLDQCDVICYAYDSSDPESFQYLVDLREKYSSRHTNNGSLNGNMNSVNSISSSIGAVVGGVTGTVGGIDDHHHHNYNTNNHLDEIPSVFVALKADLDKQQQRSDIQPENYTRDLFLSSPIHISSSWPTSIHELFIQLVDAAKNPRTATPGLETEPEDADLENMKHLILAGGAIGIMSIVSIWIWKSSLQSTR